MLFPNILTNPIISKIQIFVTSHFRTLIKFQYSRVSPHNRLLAKEPEDSRYEIEASFNRKLLISVSTVHVPKIKK